MKPIKSEIPDNADRHFHRQMIIALVIAISTVLLVIVGGQS